MNNKIETKFKDRMKDEVYIDGATVKKIKDLRQKVFDKIKDSHLKTYFEIYYKTFEGCCAFDRKTEIKKETYCIPLFIMFSSSGYDIKEKNGSFKVEINNPVLQPIAHKNILIPYNMFELINNLINPDNEINDESKIKEDNIELKIIPCLYSKSKKYYLIPNDSENWKKLNIDNYEIQYDTQNEHELIIDNILLLKHWSRCHACIYSPQNNDKNKEDFEDLDEFLENSVIKFSRDNTLNEYLYLNFNKLLKFINKNIDLKFSKKTDICEKDLKNTITEDIKSSNNMIENNDIALKYFEKIFGRSKF